MSSNTVRHARRGAKEMRNAARHVKHTAQNEAGNVLHSMRQMGEHITDAVRDGMGNIRETALDYIDQGKATAQSLEKRVEGQVQQRPLMSVLVAVGFGFLMGFFYNRR